MIKAIETQYKGYRFRSRLEARWAVFFDAMGLRWEYEPEGYDLGKEGWYLPDFLIRSEKGLPWIFIEIKPEYNQSYIDKLVVFADKVKHDVLFDLIIGTPGDERILRYCWNCGSIVDGLHEVYQGEYATWCDIVKCQFMNHSQPWANCPHTARAYAAARSARFEHQQTRSLINTPAPGMPINFADQSVFDRANESVSDDLKLAYREAFKTFLFVDKQAGAAQLRKAVRDFGKYPKNNYKADWFLLRCLMSRGKLPISLELYSLAKGEDK